jgi:general stress protein 26
MTRNMKRFILDMLRKRSTIKLATVRPDGYPQATTVAYANDGLVLYFMCDLDAQKVHNIAKNKKISLAIDGESADWDHIHGISMGGTAKLVDSTVERRRAIRLLGDKFPSMARHV